MHLGENEPSPNLPNNERSNDHNGVWSSEKKVWSHYQEKQTFQDTKDENRTISSNWRDNDLPNRVQNDDTTAYELRANLKTTQEKGLNISHNLESPYIMTTNSGHSSELRVEHMVYHDVMEHDVKSNNASGRI